MAKDFSLLAEAYSRIYEAGETVTGSVAGNTGQGPQIGIPKETGPMPIERGYAGMSSIKLATSDSTKILRNISEVYKNTKEVSETLKKYNIPGTTQNLQIEATRLAGLASQIISLTPEASDERVKNKLLSSLDRDLSSFIQKPAASTGVAQSQQTQAIPTAY